MADARLEYVGSDVHFGRGYGSQSRLVFSGEQDALAAVARWQYREYTKWCAGWFDEQRFAEMVFDGSNLVVYDRNCRARDTAVVVYVSGGRRLEGSVLRCSLESCI